VGSAFKRRLHCPLSIAIERSLRHIGLDFIVENSVILELKAIEKIAAIHEAQMLTYLKLSNLKVGLIINFNSTPLKSGIRRIDKKENSLVLPVSC